MSSGIGLEAEFQGGRVGFEPEIAVFGVDEPRVRDDRVHVGPGHLPGFPFRGGFHFIQAQVADLGPALAGVELEVDRQLGHAGVVIGVAGLRQPEAGPRT